MPFHKASIRLALNSASLLLQSMGLNSTSMSSFLAASFAISISKPTMLFFSSLKPIGGKLSSKPITIFFFAAPFVSALPHPVNAIPTIISNNTNAIIFFMNKSPTPYN